MSVNRERQRLTTGCSGRSAARPAAEPERYTNGIVMRYSTKRRLAGDKAFAFSAVESTLVPNGFRVVDANPHRRVLKGPGMQSTRENSVRGATKITVEVEGETLHLRAELNGVLFMAMFVCIFPVLLWAGFAVAGLLSSAESTAALSGKALVGAAVWFVVGPALALWIRRRTTRALDDMMDNAVVFAARA